MPEFQDEGSSDLTHYIREANQNLTVDSPATANILRSVEEQEANFERLTKELQRDKLLVANQVHRSNVASETASLNSISTTNDSFSFRRSALQESTLEEDSTLIGEEVNTTALIDSAVKALKHADMTTMESIHYTSYSPQRSETYLQRTDSYTNEPLDYDNPSYDSPTRSHFIERPDAPGSPHSSLYSAPRDPYENASPAHRNPPPFGGANDYPPSEDNYNPHQNEDYPYKEDYNQRDPSGVTSGYDSDTVPRDGYGYDSLPRDRVQDDPYLRDDGYPANDQGYPGDDQGYAGDDRRYPVEDGRHPEDNYSHDDGSVRQHQDDLDYPGHGYNQPLDGYGAPGNYPDMNDGDLRRSPAFDGDIVPQNALMQESAVGSDPMVGDEWRGPDLAEVIEFLSSRDETVVSNAAAYLQHLTYGDDGIKNKTRGLNGIPVLVDLLNNKSPDIHRSACGALRNISFGKANEENKVAIKNAEGIPTLVRLLKHTKSEDIRELVTGTLWNLSSAEPLKMMILDQAVPSLIQRELIPETGWDPRVDENVILRNDQPWSKVFKNCLGVIRNVSSGGVDARKRLRKAEGLIEILIHILSGAAGNNDMDNKCVEHAICIIRNLSFQTAQEIDHPDTNTPKTATSSQGNKKTQQNAPPAGKADVFGCFSSNKKKGSAYTNTNNKPTSSSSLGRGTLESPSVADSHTPIGVEYIWNLGSVRVYVALLSEGSNPVTLEAAAGTIQNITAGDSRMAINVRSHVRKEKGLPVMVELLRIDKDRVVLALARALRNLAVDARNKELIGQYAMKDLVFRLPGGGSDNSIKALSMESLAAVLHLLHEVIKNNQEHAKALRNANGIDTVITISKAGHKYPPAVIRGAIQVLHALWAFRDLRTYYRSDGYDEKDFLTGVWTVKRTTTQGKSPSTNTNGRPPTSPDASNYYTKSNQQEVHAAPLPIDNFSSETLDSRPPDYVQKGGTMDRGYEERSLDREYGYQQQDMQFTDPAAYIRDSYSTHSSEGVLDRQDPQEEIPMRDLHISSYPDQSSDMGSLSRSRPPVGGVPVYGRAPEPQVESRALEQDDYHQEQARSPSHESNYASDYGRTDSYRPDDYRHDDYSQRDDYSHQDGYAPHDGYAPQDGYAPEEDLSRQGSYHPDDYRDGDGDRRDDYSAAYRGAEVDEFLGFQGEVGPGGDNYGHIADYGQDDYQSGNYSVRINAESGMPNNPNSDSWV